MPKKYKKIRVRVFKELGQEYAEVLEFVGDGICKAACMDGGTRLCSFRSRMHKRDWLHAGDFILVGKRDLRKNGKADVLFKYTADEARLLKEEDADYSSQSEDDDIGGT
ncbi:hypothetical protein IFM89_026355 [Coptis chinensis]|uniref:S1-like domain-containing protein n=1 Tax=Coptis chinensis TaxID=261450 RepID=A0A835HPU8_9MAGN|nr:hypothetical protein IFM89_026355 [Coptis chinensis]